MLAVAVGLNMREQRMALYTWLLAGVGARPDDDGRLLLSCNRHHRILL